MVHAHTQGCGVIMRHDLARRLRRDQTIFERKLWYALRNRRFLAHKFRRQQPLGPYVADFVSLESKLVIELDGSGHAEPEKIESDRLRTLFLESRGFRVLRFWNPELIDNFDGVMDTIYHALLELTPHPRRDA